MCIRDRYPTQSGKGVSQGLAGVRKAARENKEMKFTALLPVSYTHLRVHRSAIVNIDSILQLQPISHGEFEIVLKDGHRSRLSRTYRRQLEKRLGQSL